MVPAAGSRAGWRRPSEVKPSLVRQWQHELRAKLDHGSVMACRSLLNRILQAAEDERLIPDNPVGRGDREGTDASLGVPSKPIDGAVFPAQTRQDLRKHSGPRSAFPLQSENLRPSGGPVRRARWHGSLGAVNARVSGPVDNRVENPR